jgi:hypothetical protein
MTSIQTALSGLLSATALPLLPDGSSYAASEPSDTIPKDPMPETETSLSPNIHKCWEHSLTKGKSKPSTSCGTSGTKSVDHSVGCVCGENEFEYEDGKIQSPTYEEAEDFAATIAKLRSLLEQRESQTNMMEGIEEKDMRTTDSHTHPQPTKTSVSKVRPSLYSESSASSVGSDGSGGTTFGTGSVDAERQFNTKSHKSVPSITLNFCYLVSSSELMTRMKMRVMQ